MNYLKKLKVTKLLVIICSIFSVPISVSGYSSQYEDVISPFSYDNANLLTMDYSGLKGIMHLPALWPGKNENKISILDQRPDDPEISVLTESVLDQLRLDKDSSEAKRPKVKLNIQDKKAVWSGTFQSGNKAQTISFQETAKGRYFCLQALSSQDGKPYAAVAELNILDQNGNPISHQNWSIAYVSSEETNRENAAAENAIDGQTSTFWHSEWGSASPAYPHEIVIDLGKDETISGFTYVPRMQENVPGRIKNCRIFIGDNLVQK